MHSSHIRVLTFCAALNWVGTATAAPGDLDALFGNGGLVITALPGGWSDVLWDLKAQSDGKILACGATELVGDFTFALARYNADGSPDTGFGTGGNVTTAFSSSSNGYCLAVQTDGKIVVAGNNDFLGVFAMARYKPDGGLDTTFGSGGRVTTSFHASDSYAAASSIVLQSNGRIVLAGWIEDFAGSPAGSNFALARYTAGGVLDNTFGAGGKVTTDLGGADRVSRIRLLSDGKFLVAGSSLSAFTTDTDIALARYTPAGALDTTFGTGGKVITNLSGYQTSAACLLVLNDGKFLIAGTWDDYSRKGMLVARYLPNGSFDGTFGAGGKVLIDPAGDFTYDSASEAMLQADGKILVAGNSQIHGRNSIMLLRLHPDGTPDEDFGPGGVQKTPFSIVESVKATCAALQSDGKILVGGTYETGGFIDFALLRYAGTPALSPLQNWRLTWFGTTENISAAADDADADADGLVNLTEWACGLDPLAFSAMPYALTQNASDLEFTFRRSLDAQQAGTGFIVEWTDSLSNGPWSDAGVTMEVGSSEEGHEQVKAALPAGTAGRRYVRLKVTAP